MRRNVKRLLSLLFVCLSIALLIVAVPTIASAAETSQPVVVAEEATTPTDNGVCGSKATWEFYEETGTLKILGSGSMNSYSYGNAPWYVYNSKITRLEVADGITSISNGAFYGLSSLKEISVPFVGASRTATETSATFGYIFGYTTENAYQAGGTNKYKLNSETLKSTLENYSFYVRFGGVTTNTSSKTFKDYIVSSSSTSIPSGTTWQYTCDDYNKQWRYSTTSETYYYWSQSYFYYIPSSLTKVTITDATKIEKAAFMNCKNITELNLNDGIESIAEYAFRWCNKLEVFNLPKNLTSLGRYALYDCDSLKSVTFPSGMTQISDYTFYDCDSLTTVKFSDNITYIGTYSFYSCGALKNADFPENLKEISGRAFESCTSFTEIVIPDKVTLINAYAFSGCYNTKTLTIGKSVKTIYSYAFNNLSKVEKIVVPDSAISISEGVFKGCTSLKEISLPFVGASRTATGPNATFGYIFGYTTENAYQAGGTNKYKLNSETLKSTLENYSFYVRFGGVTTNTSSKTFKDYIVSSSSTSIPSGTTWQYTCDDYNKQWRYSTTSETYYYWSQSYFYYIPSSLTKVTITDATKIEKVAFMNCTNITELNLNTGIESISDYAFRNFGMIEKSTDAFVVSGDILLAYKGTNKNVVIPENIRVIAPRAFYNKSTLSSVTLADKTSIIGDYAFYYCSNTAVYVPRISGGLTIGSGAFLGTGSVNYLDKSSYTNGNDTLYYTVDENGNAIIVGCTTTSDQMTLPVTLGGYTVTGVGYKGMANCTTLKSVTIPSNIVKLDLYAFYGCTGLDTVTIPATCVYIGNNAFSGCSSMTNVVIAEGVTHIGDNCFENCTSLPKVVVPDSCTYLGEYAFYNCTSLQSVTIGITVPSIGRYTFYNCESLATAVIGLKVESIGEYAFYNTGIVVLTTPTGLKHIGDYSFANCDSLEKVALKAGLLTIGDGAFMGDSSLTTVTWPANITSIGSYAFYGCESLANATLPAGVTEIKDYAFAYCSSLASITVKGTVTSIGEKAFYRDALTTFTFTEGLTSIGANAFAFNSLESITLPNSLVSIGEKAFNECASLAIVSMPDSVSYVGAYAFSADANNLTITIRKSIGKIADYILYNMDVYKIVMENGITEIGDYAFALCHKLTEITFPNTIKVIGDYAFYDNRMYSSITLPSGLEHIGSYSFARGYRLTEFYIPDSVLTIGTNAFYNEEAGNHVDPAFTIVIYYNKGAITDGLLDGQPVHHVIVSDNIHTIGNNAFSNCANLKDIVLPDTISSFGSNCFLNDKSIIINFKKVDGLIDSGVYREKLSGVGTINISDINIGDYAFYGNKTIKNVNIENNVNIGEYAFAENTSTKKLTINGQTNIGDYAFSNNIALLNATVTGTSNIGNYSFYNCNSMTDFVINGTIERIGSHAFDSCKSLKAMALPTTVNYIGSHAFYDCNSMVSINIPNGVEKILPYTFFGCASLGSIEVPNSVTTIEDYAFYGCVVATNITLSNQCKTIGDYAFYNCKSLTELIIPDSVTSIGEYAFRSCGGVTELIFSDNVEKIGTCAFYDCSGLKTVKLGKKIIALGDRMFYGCVNLESLYVYAPLSYIDELAFYGADFVTVYCGRDDYMINFFDENGIFYEILDDLVYEYKITFVNENGEIISSATYISGSTVTPPADPQKPSDNTYNYVFAGWDQDVTVVGGNKTYTAIFTPVYIDYTVVFKDYNGNVISSQTYHYGDAIAIPTDPMRVADNTYTYAFAGWDKAVVDCDGNAVYTATYTPTYIDYTVVFKDWNGNVISTETYHYGDKVVIPTKPTRAADNTYTYTFAGWDNAVVDCNGNVTYTATYDATYIDYTVVFKDANGTVLSTNTYHYGDKVIVPTSPTKEADNTYTYAFAGWDKAVVNCDGNVTYTATYTPTYIDYTVVFKNWNGSVITAKTYHYGDKIIIPSDPTKASDNTYTYAFAGWDKVVVDCDGNAIYTATYTPVYIDYTVIFKDADGREISKKTYHWGETITIPADPMKDMDQIGSYSFTGWDKEVVACNGNATYMATYTVDYTDYTVIFKNWNGDVISTKTYHWGDNIVVPDDPSRIADNTYTYAFAGWDYVVVDCEGDATYTATYTPSYINYNIVFKNWNGSVLSAKTYHYGDKVTDPTAPTKSADNTYTYTFAGWDKTVVNCAGNVTYTATYTPVYIDYTVIFKDEDGSEISKKTYHWGDVVTVPTNPTKTTDHIGTYSFAGWDKNVVACAGNVTYTATYTTNYTDYTVVFRNWNGDAISTKTYHWGDSVVIPNNPTKAADNTYTYAFAGWDKTVVDCAGDATYTATYTPTYINYTVVFKNWNGTVLSTKTYHYGDKVTIPTTPTKTSNSTYTYTFAGWDKTVVNCAGNTTYTATFTPVYINYTITFKNWDGSVLATNTYHYGDIVQEPNTPTKESDLYGTYLFSSWDKSVTNCAGDATYIATYKTEYTDYVVKFQNWNGTIISSKTYHYGDKVTAPSNPSKSADNTYTYTFAGWDKTVINCAGNTTYIATYTPTYIDYTIVFNNWNGELISSSTYHYGDVVELPEEPTKEKDGYYIYTFAGWNSEVILCAGNAEYKAVFDAEHYHTYKTSVINPTCTNEGYTKNTCACGNTYNDKFVNSLGHIYSNNCDTSCNVCKTTRTITHTYKTTTTKATTSKNGSVVSKCKVCGKEKTSTIYKASKVYLSTTEYTYNGKTKKPSVKVYDSKGNKLEYGEDYTYSRPSSSKYVGKYKIKITFKGDYTGTKTLYYTINPKGTKVSSLTAGKKSLKVKISKQSSQTTGYEIQYSTSKKFASKYTKTKKISSYKTTSITLTSLKAKKTYYVRVRTYKIVDGKKYYSDWSTYKYVKTK